MQSSSVTTTSTLRRLVLASMLLMSIASCRTADTIAVRSTAHDTLSVTHQQYDSVYVFDGIVPNDSTTLSQILPSNSKLAIPLSSMKNSSVGLHIEYRYKYLRDTTYIHKVDTIPKIICTPSSGTTSSINRPLILIIVILLIIILIAHKFR